MLIDVSKKELEVIINQLWKSRKSEEQVGEVYERLKPFLDICTCRESIVADDSHDSLSEEKDQPQPVEEVSTIHRRRDLDLL
tara:strand:- start:77 stop:322 length:246 start_codon:yes stop_codon:yes gene_type:complete